MFLPVAAAIKGVDYMNRRRGRGVSTADMYAESAMRCAACIRTINSLGSGGGHQCVPSTIEPTVYCATLRDLWVFSSMMPMVVLRTCPPLHVVSHHPCTQSCHFPHHFADRRLVILLLLSLSDNECPLYVEKEARVVA